MIYTKTCIKNYYLSKRSCIIYFLASFTLATGCKKEPITDNSLVPDHHKANVRHVDTFFIMPSTVFEDSLQTTNLRYYIAGCMKDPIFGTSTANIYSHVLLSANNLDLGEELVLDSIFLYLKHVGDYGDTASVQTIQVLEVTDDIDPSAIYYSNQSFETETLPIGLADVAPSQVKEILKIPLESSFGEKLLAQSGTVNFTENSVFREFFKGISIQVDTSLTTTGNMLYFDLNSSQSKITLFYSNQSDSGLSIDFVLTENGGNILNNYNQYPSNLLKDAVQNRQSQLLFVQSMASCKSKLLFPSIKNLKNVIINNALLTVTQSDSLTNADSIFNPPQEMLLVRVDQNGSNNFNLPDLFLGSDYFGGKKIIKNGLSTYQFNITQHIQSVINGDYEDYGLYLINASSSLTADRIVLDGKNANNSVKFTITYTELN